MILRPNHIYGLNLETNKEKPKAEIRLTHEIESKSRLETEQRSRSGLETE